MALRIIVVIMWVTMATLVMIEYAPLCKDLTKMGKLVVCIIFMVGGPFFGIANALTAILDTFLPEGWDDDDSKKC